MMNDFLAVALFILVSGLLGFCSVTVIKAAFGDTPFDPKE
jgi:hypothetical protein